MHYHNQERTDFVVRHANSLDDLQWATSQVTASRVRSVKEVDCYFTSGLTSNFFIGELKGKRISCIALVWHGESTGFGGSFFVEKPFRGMRYGMDTLQAVYTDDVIDKCILQTYVAPKWQDYYIERFGFQPGWLTRQYRLSISVVKQRFSSCQSSESPAKILQASLANFEELVTYGADMIGTSPVCKSMLAAMLVHAQESSWVAVDIEGKIVGYLIMNKTVRFPEDGYVIGPFFADNVSIARILLKTAAEFAAQDANQPRFISLDVSMPNEECVKIMENELGAEQIEDAVFLGTKGIPNKAHEKMFSLANLVVL
jgi:hypothetical protein